jgi:hypothetical protein
MGQKTAQTYCCTKGMHLVKVETPSKRECMQNELASERISRSKLLHQCDYFSCVQLDMTLFTTFWTSGTSDKCPKTFGWCGGSDKEFVDFEGLGMKNFDLMGGFECLSITLDRKGSKASLLMQSESCSNKRRAICEVISY